DRPPPTQVNRGRGEVPATIQQLPGGGYTVTGGSPGQQVIVVPSQQQGGGVGKWILILLLIGLVGAGAVIGLVPEIRTKVLASMGVQQQTGEAGGSASGGAVTPAPLPRLRIIDTEVWEGADGRTTAATFRVETAGTFQDPITVDWKVVYGSFGGKTPATEADLAEPTSGKLTIQPGGSGSIVLNVKGNNRYEPDKSLAVEISNPSGATIDRAQAVLTILNDDPKPTIPTLTITGPPAGVVEGNEGTTDAVFTVRLSEKIDREVTFKFSTLDATPLHGTAAANDDYIPVAGQELRIAAGQTEAQAIVKIKGDTDVEPDEKLTVFIHDASGADIAGNGQATVTPRKDDQPPLPTLTILDAAPVQEGNPPNVGELVFVVRLSEPTTELVTFDAMTVPAGVANAATPGEDFDAVPRQTYTIRAGLQQIEIRVRIKPDTNEEPDEIVAVQIANARGAKIGRDRATGTILNDDRPNIVENPPQQNFQQLALAIEQAARVGQWEEMLEKLTALASIAQAGQTSDFVRTANTALAQFRLRNAIRAARTAQFPRLREQLDKIIAVGEPVEAIVAKIEMLIEYDREDQIEIVTRNNPQATAGFREAINLAGKLVNGNHRNRLEVYGYVGDVFFTVPALQDVRLALQWYEAGSQAGAAYCTARKGNLLWQSARANNDQQMFQQAIAAMKQASEQQPVHRYALHLYGYFLLLQYDQNPELARQYFQEGSALLRRAADMGFQASLKELIRRGLN
ncbi:MAG TPA: Calx-beta domain-containing protein, partial [Tepidisphaeraceae bacterium]|nr:Calx-beta domain-containing protein [Tepidisphaeraceae bacterium]